MNDQAEALVMRPQKGDEHAHERALGAPLPHESAEAHVSGEARYTDDIPELHGTVHAASAR